MDRNRDTSSINADSKPFILCYVNLMSLLKGVLLSPALLLTYPSRNKIVWDNHSFISCLY